MLSKSSDNLKKNFNEFNFRFLERKLVRQKWGLNLRYNLVSNIKTFVYSKAIVSIKKQSDGEINTRRCVDFLMQTKTYRGIRHKLNYPCRGQRTHTNAKTSKKYANKG